MSLKRNFAWMAVGRGIYAVCQWLLLIIIARITSPETLGEFTYAMAVTAPIIIFSQLNLRAYMVTDSLEQFSFSDYRNARIASTVLAIAAIITISLLNRSNASIAMLIFIIGSYKAAESVSDIYYGVLQKQEKMQRIAISVAAHGLLSVAIMLFAVLTTKNAVLGAVGVAVAWLLLLAMYDIPGAKAATRPGESKTVHLAQVVTTCLPFGIVLALMSLRMNLPVYFIKSELGTAQVGFYTAVAYFMIAGNLVTDSLIQAAAPRLATHHNAGEADLFLKLLKKLLGIAALLGAIGVVVSFVLGELILSLTYGPAYRNYATLLVVLMFAAAVGYFVQFAGVCLTIARLHYYQLASNLIGAAFIVLAALTLIPRFGLSGGAISLLIGLIAILMINTLVIQSKILGPLRLRAIAQSR